MPRYIKTHRSREIKKSVLVVAMHIVNEIKNTGEYKLNDMLVFLQKKLKIEQKDFMYTINFLFILGKLEYEKESDIIRFIK